jgi:hypothetical protein
MVSIFDSPVTVQFERYFIVTKDTEEEMNTSRIDKYNGTLSIVFETDLCNAQETSILRAIALMATFRWKGIYIYIYIYIFVISPI